MIPVRWRCRPGATPFANARGVDVRRPWVCSPGGRYGDRRSPPRTRLPLPTCCTADLVKSSRPSAGAGPAGGGLCRPHDWDGPRHFVYGHVEHHLGRGAPWSPPCGCDGPCADAKQGGMRRAVTFCPCVGLCRPLGLVCRTEVAGPSSARPEHRRCADNAGLRLLLVDGAGARGCTRRPPGSGLLFPPRFYPWSASSACRRRIGLRCGAEAVDPAAAVDVPAPGDAHWAGRLVVKAATNDV